VTVEELICEILASAHGLNDEVWVGNTPGPVIQVSSGAGNTILLNDYEDEPVEKGQ